MNKTFFLLLTLILLHSCVAINKQLTLNDFALVMERNDFKVYVGQNIKEDYLKFLIQIVQKYHGVNFSSMLDFSLMSKWLWYLK